MAGRDRFATGLPTVVDPKNNWIGACIDRPECGDAGFEIGLGQAIGVLLLRAVADDFDGQIDGPLQFHEPTWRTAGFRDQTHPPVFNAVMGYADHVRLRCRRLSFDPRKVPALSAFRLFGYSVRGSPVTLDLQASS